MGSEATKHSVGSFTDPGQGPLQYFLYPEVLFCFVPSVPKA